MQYTTLQAVTPSNWSLWRGAVTNLYWNQVGESGWNPGRHDYRVYVHSDQNRFYLILYRESVIGCVCLFHAGDALGVGSFYISAPWRGRKIGSEVLDIIFRNNPGKSPYLLCTPESAKFYQKKGFQSAEFAILTCTLTICPHQFQGIPIPGYPIAAAKLTEKDLEEVLKFDLRLYPIDRSKLLKTLIADRKTITVVAPPEPTHLPWQPPTIAGYGIARPLANGYRLSIFALRKPVFQNILCSLITKIAAASLLTQSVKIVIDCVEEKEDDFKPYGFTCTERYPLLYIPSPGNLSYPQAVNYVINPKTYCILTEECG